MTPATTPAVTDEQIIDLVYECDLLCGLISEQNAIDFARAILDLATPSPGKAPEPVARIRVWTKPNGQHADLIDWEDGLDSLPDGEHVLYASPGKAEAEDAARYRWLRERGGYSAHVWLDGQKDKAVRAINSDYDAVIDAAIQRERCDTIPRNTRGKS